MDPFDTCHFHLDSFWLLVLMHFVTAGQERFRSISTSYYRGANGILLVYSIDRRDSFKQIQHYYNEAQRSVGENMAFILIGNKLDLQASREVSFDEGQAFAVANNMLFFEVSAKDLSNMGEMVQTLYNEMYMKQWESGATGVNFKCTFKYSNNRIKHIC